VWDLPTSKGRTSKTYWKTTTIIDIWVEVGGYHYGLLRGKKVNNVIWVIIDRLTRSVLFLSIKMTASVDKLVRLYINR